MESETQTQNADRTDQFGEQSVIKLLLRFSLPTIVAMMIQSSYNFINMIFVGQKLGPLAIAAIAICNPITMIQGAINQLVANGCSTAVAIRLGQGDRDGSRVLLGSSVALSLLIATGTNILGHAFMDPLLRLFGASEAILPYARDYLNITLFGMQVNCLMSMNAMMRIEGFPGRAMVTMLLSTVVNLICTPTFLFVFELGIRGAALGTLCAQVASATWIFVFLIGKDRIIGLKWRYFRPKLDCVRQVMRLGLPNCLMSLSQSMLSIILNKSLGAYGGDIAISAWGITNNINNLIAQPIFGLNQGIQPIVSYNVGAKKYLRVKHALFCSLATATFFSAVGWLITRLFPAQIFAFFNDDPALIALGVRMLIVFRMFIIVVGAQQAGAAYFQHTGNPKISILLSLSRQVLILIPCVLILPRFFHFDGILYAGPISDLLSITMTGIFLFFEVRRLNRLAEGCISQTGIV